MAHEFTITRRVEFADTDMAGIMHFANFFRFMEAAEHAFFRSLGLSVQQEIDGRTIGWPRVNVSCHFVHPLRFEEEVRIHLQVRGISEKSIDYAFDFKKMDNGEEILVAHGVTTAVCAVIGGDGGQIHAIPIPELIRKKIEAAPS